MTDSRDLSALHPVMRKRVDKFLTACAMWGIKVIVTCTLRSLATQAALYAQGRTLPGKRCTNAEPGQSLHNYGLAIDVVPMVGKELIWNDKGARNHALWQNIGRIGDEAGLSWSGKWEGRLKELGHFEMPIHWSKLIAKSTEELDKELWVFL